MDSGVNVPKRMRVEHFPGRRRGHRRVNPTHRKERDECGPSLLLRGPWQKFD